MRSPCTKWESWVAEDPSAPDPSSAAHLEVCSTCREQWGVHAALSGLREIPTPSLSSDLEARVRRALGDQPSRPMLSTTARRLMRIYWLGATFAAGLVLAQVDGSTTPWLTVALGLGALGLASVPALVFLRRRLSWDVMDLVIWTMR